MNDINIVGELKDLLNEYINIMCVTEDKEYDLLYRKNI